MNAAKRIAKEEEKMTMESSGNFLTVISRAKAAVEAAAAAAVGDSKSVSVGTGVGAEGEVPLWSVDDRDIWPYDVRDD